MLKNKKEVLKSRHLSNALVGIMGVGVQESGEISVVHVRCSLVTTLLSELAEVAN